MPLLEGVLLGMLVFRLLVEIGEVVVGWEGCLNRTTSIHVSSTGCDNVLSHPDLEFSCKDLQ